MYTCFATWRKILMMLWCRKSLADHLIFFLFIISVTVARTANVISVEWAVGRTNRLFDEVIFSVFILCSLNLSTSAVFFTWESLFWSCSSIMNRPQQQKPFCACSYDILCMSEMCRSAFISSDFIWCSVCLKLCFILAECQAICNWFFRWWQEYFQNFQECNTESESERKK